MTHVDKRMGWWILIGAIIFSAALKIVQWPYQPSLPYTPIDAQEREAHP